MKKIILSLCLFTSTLVKAGLISHAIAYGLGKDAAREQSHGYCQSNGIPEIMYMLQQRGEQNDGNYFTYSNGNQMIQISMGDNVFLDSAQDYAQLISAVAIIKSMPEFHYALPIIKQTLISKGVDVSSINFEVEEKKEEKKEESWFEQNKPILGAIAIFLVLMSGFFVIG